MYKYTYEWEENNCTNNFSIYFSIEITKLNIFLILLDKVNFVIVESKHIKICYPTNMII